MKVQAFVILSLAATVLAVPHHQLQRRQADATTAAPSAVDCGSGSPTGLSGLLSQVGNLLDNILANVGGITVQGLIGGRESVINLRNLINQVRELLKVLLGGSSLSENDTPQNQGLLTTLIGQITSLLNNLLGGRTGDDYACTNNGGAIGGLLGNLTDNALLGGLLTPVLGLVQGLLALLV